jgi:uncharacterized protein (UPF0332 family)
MLRVNLTEDAGRAAYLAGYHAAQALIFERNGTATKTHRGAQSEFARLARIEPSIDDELRRFLPRTYDLKAVCDYELGPDAVVPHEQAEAAIRDPVRFIACITALLAAETGHPPDLSD